MINPRARTGMQAWPVVVILAGWALIVPRALAAERLQDLLKRPDTWFRGPESRRIAGNILSYQSNQGSWPKNIDTIHEPFMGERSTLHGTFDNGATFGELRFLARAHWATGEESYQGAFLKGLDHILAAQYPNGGWPQYSPPGVGYQKYITFNDGAMVHVLEFLREVARSDGFSFVDEARRSRAARAFDAGIQCILRCQISVKGELTIWCAQHDEKTFEPRWARSFEPPSLTSAESAGIVRLLMSMDNPSSAVREAIHGAAHWFASSALMGIRQVTRDGDKFLVADPDAPALWARFYEIGTNRPIFCGRDSVIRYDIREIEPERRNGYAWYGSSGHEVARAYAAWCQRRRLNEK